MKTNEIYAKYMTPQSLQNHMLWVASLAKILLDHWKGLELDRDSIVTACLFHDIAKPMHFDLAKQAQFGMSQEDIQKLKELQTRIKTRYVSNEHHATVMICQEIGLSEKAIHLVDNLEWKYIPRLLQAHDIKSLIPIYCDMRIGPKGILPLQVRLQELKDRVGDDEYADNVKNGSLIEKEMIKNVSINIHAITNQQLDAQVTQLLHLAIT